MWKISTHVVLLTFLRISTQSTVSGAEGETRVSAESLSYTKPLSFDETRVELKHINSENIIDEKMSINVAEIRQNDAVPISSQVSALSKSGANKNDQFSQNGHECYSLNHKIIQEFSDHGDASLTLTSTIVLSTETNAAPLSEERGVFEHELSSISEKLLSLTPIPTAHETSYIPAHTQPQSPTNVPESVLFNFEAFSVNSEPVESQTVSMTLAKSESIEKLSSSGQANPVSNSLNSTEVLEAQIIQHHHADSVPASFSPQETNLNERESLLLPNISTNDYEDSARNTSDDCRFIPFEEWKKLKEAGKTPNTIPINNVNESSEKTLSDVVEPKNSSEVPENKITPLIEDQGRVYKDKFNYASGDCAATIVQTNSDAKGASAILKEVKDSYLLNKCSTSNKFVIIELCQDILVSSVVMGNFELFSSMFREVKFSVSDRFPVTKGWHELGQFEASNIRDVQTFNISNPLIWARYLKIEILSHFGNEFYCPISLVRVHGKTMMEEFKDTDVNGEPSASESSISVPTQEIIDGNTESKSNDDDCKVVTPYLALKEFLKDFNTTTDYCDPSLAPLNYSQTTTAESNNNRPAQESIFQNIVKRLSLLERNATLSLLYVEEQSKLLSDAFFNLETRQVRKFENLFNSLNQTMHTQVLFLERAVERIRIDSQSLLYDHSSQLSRSITNISADAFTFAREVSFLKKVVVADTIIILSLLVYVVMTRGTLTVEEITGKQRPKKSETEESGKTPLKSLPTRHNRSKARKKK